MAAVNDPNHRVGGLLLRSEKWRIRSQYSMYLFGYLAVVLISWAVRDNTFAMPVTKISHGTENIFLVYSQLTKF